MLARAQKALGTSGLKATVDAALQAAVEQVLRARLARRILSGEGIDRSPQLWVTALTANQLAICDQVRMEILYSARTAVDYEALDEELAALVEIPIDSATHRRAHDVQRELASVGELHHRSVKIAALTVAAAAERFGAIVWHYDEDFDRIAAITGQRTEWIAPPGSL